MELAKFTYQEEPRAAAIGQDESTVTLASCETGKTSDLVSYMSVTIFTVDSNQRDPTSFRHVRGGNGSERAHR